jgi:hypothetical protein
MKVVGNEIALQTLTIGLSKSIKIFDILFIEKNRGL